MQYMQRLQRGDIKLALYRSMQTRSGAKVLLLHGYPDCARVWRPVMQALSADHEVWTYDMRGCGLSDQPRKLADYKLNELMLDLLAVLDTISPDQPVHVVAHDWGSFQGWEAVTDARFANRIMSYTSISGPCLDHASFWLRDQWSQQGPLSVLRQLGKSWYMALFQIPGIAPAVWRMTGDRGWRVLAKLLDGTNPEPEPSRVRDGANGVNWYRANLRSKLLKPEQRRTRIPVQLLVPTEDPFADVNIYDSIPRWCQSIERHDIAAGHWVVTSHADWVAGQASQFMQKIEQQQQAA